MPGFHFDTALLQVMKNGFCMETENKKEQLPQNEKSVPTSKPRLHPQKSVVGGISANRYQMKEDNIKQNQDLSKKKKKNLFLSKKIH